MQNLDTLLRKIENLPTLPMVAMKILKIVDNPRSSVRDMEKVVSTDPPLAGRVIKMVNSAAFGVPQQVSSIHQAIALLGFNLVKSLCLGVSIFDRFDRSLQEIGYRREDYWRHSVAVGTLARLFARRQTGVDADHAFAAGLFHDLGLLVEDQYFHADFVRVVEAAEAEGIAFHEAEARLGTLDHAEIGGWLLRRWKFAEELAEPVRRHHDPFGAENYPRHSIVVAAADYLCDRAGVGYRPDAGRPDPGERLWQALNVPAPERELSLAQAVAAAKEMGG